MEQTIEQLQALKIKHLQALIKKIDDKKPPVSVFDSSESYKIDYKKELNKEQLTAVSIVDKPLLIIAGAGTGKTRVIIYKVAYLIENGIRPENILLLTFTHKAADEMLTRVDNLLDYKTGKRVKGGTFHSFAITVLRKHADMIDIPANFTVCDQGDSASKITQLRKKLPRR